MAAQCCIFRLLDLDFQIANIEKVHVEDVLTHMSCCLNPGNKWKKMLGNKFAFFILMKTETRTLTCSHFKGEYPYNSQKHIAAISEWS